MKTNPIGVRFDNELLEKLRGEGKVDTAQSALNFYEKFYVKTLEKASKPPRIKKIVSDRIKPEQIVSEPKEGSIAFYNKYGVGTNEERFGSLLDLLPDS